MSLDVNALGLVHVCYAEGTVEIPTGIDGNYNW